MNRRTLSVAVGLAALALGVWWLFRPSGGGAAAGKKVEAYWYCPECAFKMPATADQDASLVVCPHCRKKGNVVGLRPGDAGGLGLGSKRTLVPAITLGAMALMALIVFWFRPSRRRAKAEALHYFKCQQCRRKIRYRPSQAGSKALCPVCKVEFTFPALSGVARA
jgi:hypothetical protein